MKLKPHIKKNPNIFLSYSPIQTQPPIKKKNTFCTKNKPMIACCTILVFIILLALLAVIIGVLIGGSSEKDKLPLFLNFFENFSQKF